VIRILGHRRSRPEVLPEALVGALVLVAEGAGGLAKLRQIAVLEEGVPRVGGEATEEIRP
jgi:hypothetical protein